MLTSASPVVDNHITQTASDEAKERKRRRKETAFVRKKHPNKLDSETKTLSTSGLPEVITFIATTSMFPILGKQKTCSILAFPKKQIPVQVSFRIRLKTWKIHVIELKIEKR